MEGASASALGWASRWWHLSLLQEDFVDFQAALWISVGIAAIALLASAWVQGTIAHRGEKV
jgi:ABC-type spermidine/putrescine transport system permease subunit II